MRNARENQELAFTMFAEAARRGLMYHVAEDEQLSGRTIRVNGQDWINFGSCSYLGLEFDSRLKSGAIDAIQRYGTQFSSSRAMVSSPPYAELESLLTRLFGVEPLICSSTSLGHIGAIPMLVDDADAIVLDQQVHMSVETASRLARVNGTAIHIIRHNRIDQLAELLKGLAKRHRRIWYMADGLYSMFGDLAPLEELFALLDENEQLWLYVDDAHAMSWCGRNGRGYASGPGELHERVVIATSLNKAFACAGGVLLMRDAAVRQRIKTVGGPYIYSGPIQPPMLGAALASAQLHLSPGFTAIQNELQERIQYCNGLLRERAIPLISQHETPIRFIGTGSPRATYAMVDRLQKDGLYVNVATFPVVPMKKAGLRLTLTRHHQLQDIKKLADALAYHLPQVLAEEGSAMTNVRTLFTLGSSDDGESTAQETAKPADSPQQTLRIERFQSAVQLHRVEWDRLLGEHGSYTVEGLRYLEATFTKQPNPQDNWQFVYYVVRDSSGHAVLATFFTAARWKEDMLAAPKLSRLVEEKRALEPDLLTSLVYSMGALLTEGQHLYLDRNANWKEAIRLLMRAVELDAKQFDCKTAIIRDLPDDDQELTEQLLGYGYAKLQMPESLVLDIDWSSESEYRQKLSKKSRRHLTSAVARWDDAYQVDVLRKGDSGWMSLEWEQLYTLYRHVHARGLEFNTFPLPPAFLYNLPDYDCWELVVLRSRSAEVSRHIGEPVAFLVSFVGAHHYAPIVAGLNYDYVKTQGAYRQLLRNAIRRAQALGKRRVLFGFGAALEKRRLGARIEQRAYFIQTEDSFSMDLMAKMFADAT